MERLTCLLLAPFREKYLLPLTGREISYDCIAVEAVPLLMSVCDVLAREKQAFNPQFL
jgi:hypothetical protein